jgi:hypothetical protein
VIDIGFLLRGGWRSLCLYFCPLYLREKPQAWAVNKGGRLPRSILMPGCCEEEAGAVGEGGAMGAHRVALIGLGPLKY